MSQGRLAYVGSRLLAVADGVGGTAEQNASAAAIGALKPLEAAELWRYHADREAVRLSDQPQGARHASSSVITPV